MIEKNEQLTVIFFFYIKQKVKIAVTTLLTELQLFQHWAETMTTMLRNWF